MSKIVEVKTCDLIGPALDWAVAYGANGQKAFLDAFGASMLGRSITKETLSGNIRPSTDWSQCGPLIEKYAVELAPPTSATDFWWAAAWGATSRYLIDGETALIAACRAIVAAKLGYVVSVPAELVQQPTEGSSHEQ